MATDRYRPLTPFASAFAAEYKGFMKANGITNLQIAGKLLRNDGYVSERVNGKRALDTEDVDALALLVPGWTGKSLMMELARRVQEARLTAEADEISNISQFRVRSNVSGSGEAELQQEEVALAASDDPTYERRAEEGEEYP